MSEPRHRSSTHRVRCTSTASCRWKRIDKGVVPWTTYFSTAGDPRLILITCGGEYDPRVGSYDDNYIVTAEKVT